MTIVPENLEVAATYLRTNSIEETADRLQIPVIKVQEILSKTEVKRYIDQVYLDTGYRNRSKLAEVLDKMIDEKIAENNYSSEKDLLDLLKFAHQLRMDELKAHIPGSQTNVQINEFGTGNYAELMKRLIK